ncbi:MAG: DUF2029 domain-containing protein [Myxococcales bacterium]|nr:DUF2029 domain-containing protein [Myxococcales bacterium]MCH7866971.1 DUF2029 domain-containing protein [Myxococcales bacterium]
MSSPTRDDPNGMSRDSKAKRSDHVIRRGYGSYWFFAAIAVGMALRLFFTFSTSGTLDVDIWHLHTIALAKQGLISYYQGGALIFNHPPPAAWLVATLANIADATGISFAALLRLPFSLFDLASVWLILRLLAGTPHARWVAAAYWLHPLAIIYSSYHGNTDSSIAFFLLATTLLVSRNQGLWAGAALGLCLWFKIPGILAAPVFFFALPDLRERLRFCLAGGAVALIGYGPALLMNAQAVIDAVLLYPGLRIHTGSGITTWGLLNLYPDVGSLPAALRLPFVDFTQASLDYNSAICIAPIVLLGWLRRNERKPVALATSVAASFALFYGLTNFWAFQYLAWSIPFWLLSSRWLAVSASLFATVYIYGAYAWLCGDAFLLGTWDFVGKPDWPGWLIAARNTANLFFLATGLVFTLQALNAERQRYRRDAGQSSPG